jgi:phosphonoacetaldehyde hydrolase
VYPPAAVLKVGDTRADIEEGRNAGAWSVGVCLGSSEMGLEESVFAALSEDEQKQRLNATAERFHSWGAHAAIDSLADLPALVEEINQLMEEGQQP